MSNLIAEYGAMEYRNNKIYLNLNSYNGKAYIPVIKKVDLATIKIIGRDKLKGKGGQRGKDGTLKDVYVKHSSGETEFLTRAELVSKYKLLSGKSILMFKLKDNKSYYVKRNCNEEYRAMLLPAGFVNTFNGKVISGKAYAVIPINNSSASTENLDSSDSINNGLDLSKLTIISSELFKKSFVIPDNELIQKARRKSLKYNGKFNLSEFINSKIKNNTKNNITKDKNKNNINFIKDKETKKDIKNIKDVVLQENNNNKFIKDTDNIINKANIVTENNKENDSKYAFKAEARLFNASNTLIGFMLVDKKGVRLPKDLSTVSKLAGMKLISNISLVKSDNRTFLRGNGIRLEELPILKSK